MAFFRVLKSLYIYLKNVLKKAMTGVLAAAMAFTLVAPVTANARVYTGSTDGTSVPADYATASGQTTLHGSDTLTTSADDKVSLSLGLDETKTVYFASVAGLAVNPNGKSVVSNGVVNSTYSGVVSISGKTAAIKDVTVDYVSTSLTSDNVGYVKITVTGAEKVAGTATLTFYGYHGNNTNGTVSTIGTIVATVADASSIKNANSDVYLIAGDSNDSESFNISGKSLKVTDSKGEETSDDYYYVVDGEQSNGSSLVLGSGVKTLDSFGRGNLGSKNSLTFTAKSDAVVQDLSIDVYAIEETKAANLATTDSLKTKKAEASAKKTVTVHIINFAVADNNDKDVLNNGLSLDLKKNTTKTIKASSTTYPDYTYTYEDAGSNSDIFKVVKSTGVVTAVGKGTGSIKVSAIDKNGDTKFTKTVKVTVTELPYDDLTVSDGTTTLSDVSGKEYASLLSKDKITKYDGYTNPYDYLATLDAAGVKYIELDLSQNKTATLSTTAPAKGTVTYKVTDDVDKNGAATGYSKNITVGSNTGVISATGTIANNYTFSLNYVTVTEAKTSTTEESTYKVLVVVTSNPQASLEVTNNTISVGVDQQFDLSDVVKTNTEISARLASVKAYSKDDLTAARIVYYDDVPYVEGLKAGKTVHVLVTADYDNNNSTSKYQIITVNTVEKGKITSIVNQNDNSTVGSSLTIDAKTVLKINVTSGSTITVGTESDSNQTTTIFTTSYDKDNNLLTLLPNTAGTGKITIYDNYNSSNNTYTDKKEIAIIYKPVTKASKVTSVRVINKKGAKVQVKWTKKNAASIKGYKVRYKVANGSWKTKYIKSNTAKTTLKVKKGKKVYVKVAAYKTNSLGKKVIGKYSKTKIKKTDKK